MKISIGNYAKCTPFLFSPLTHGQVRQWVLRCCSPPRVAHLRGRCRTAPRPRSGGSSRRGAGCWTGGWRCSGRSPWCAHPLQPWSQVLEKCTRSNYRIFLSNGHHECLAISGWLLFPLHEECPWPQTRSLAHGMNHTIAQQQHIPVHVKAQWLSGQLLPLEQDLGTLAPTHARSSKVINRTISAQPGLIIKSLTFGDQAMLLQGSWVPW